LLDGRCFIAGHGSTRDRCTRMAQGQLRLVAALADGRAS
jgi:hypothetical protein